MSMPTNRKLTSKIPGMMSRYPNQDGGDW